MFGIAISISTVLKFVFLKIITFLDRKVKHVLKYTYQIFVMWNHDFSLNLYYVQKKKKNSYIFK